jgi:membrane associated rhomboid family serine protease
MVPIWGDEMDAWMLTSDALREPWRLWTSHLAHSDWRQAALNILALAAPLVLVQRKDRGRVLLWLFLLAPVLSLALIPSLNGHSVGGLAGLACAAWTLVGLQLLVQGDSLPVGLAMLGFLGLKITVETMTESGLLMHHGRWQTVSEPNLYGMLLGLSAGMVDETFRRFERKVRFCATRRFRKLVTIPR